MNQTKNNDQNSKIALVTKILLISLLVIVLLVVIYSVINYFGLFGRLNTAVSSDNYRVSENSLCLLKYQLAEQDYYTTWLYDAYGWTNYGLAQTYGDMTTFINAMLYNTAVSTPHAYDERAYSQAEYTLTCCEAAREAGMKLDDEDKASIDQYMDGLKSMAEANGRKLSAYLRTWVGAGVTAKDCRKLLELAVLSGKYETEMRKELEDGVTDAEIEAYKNDNKGQFYSTKYTSYSLVNESLKDKAKECKTVDDIKSMLIDYFMDKDFESNYKSIIEDKEIETTDSKDDTRAAVLATIKCWLKLTEEKGKFDVTKEDDAYVTAGYNLATALTSSIQSQIGRINANGSSPYVDPTSEKATDLEKWLFGEGRKAGDTNVITTTTETTDSSGKTTTTTSNIWYLVGEDVLKLDTAKTRAAYYTLLADDGENVENGKTADEKYAEFESGEHTGENFEKVFGATPSESLSESSLPDEMSEWLFDADRKEGDYTRLVVKTAGTDGSETKNEYVMYYKCENEENWKVSAKSYVVSQKLSDWYDEAHEKYHVTSDYKAPAPETTAATVADTAA